MGVKFNGCSLSIIMFHAYNNKSQRIKWIVLLAVELFQSYDIFPHLQTLHRSEYFIGLHIQLYC